MEFAPRQSFYSPAEELEIGGVPFPLAADDKPRREDALAYYRAVVSSRRLNLQTWERVQSARREEDDVHACETAQQPDGAWERTYRARIRRSCQRRLGSAAHAGCSRRELEKSQRAVCGPDAVSLRKTA